MIILLSDPVVVWGAELSSALPLSSSRVKMASERVEVVLGEDSAIVHVSYVFVNRGPAVKLQVAFPGQESMRRFVAKVNGKRLKTGEKRYLSAKVQDSSLVLPEGFDVAEEVLSWFGDSPWFVHELSFAKGETLRLTHSYTVGVGSDSHIFGYKEFRYYLRTGSLWAEAPDLIEVEVKLERVPAECFLGFPEPPIKPLGYVVSGNRLRWRWTAQEPNEDISITFREPEALWEGKKLRESEELRALFDRDPSTGIPLRKGDSLFIVIGNPQALSMYAYLNPERNYRIIPRLLDSLSLRFSSEESPVATCLLFCNPEQTWLGVVFGLPAIACNSAEGMRCRFVGEPGKPLPVVGVLVVAEGDGTLGEVEFYPRPAGFFNEDFWRENQRYFKGD